MRGWQRRIGVLVVAVVLVTACVVTAAPTSGAGGAIGYVITIRGGAPNTCRLEQLDLATGELTPVGVGTGDFEDCVWDLAFTPDGTTLYGIRWNVPGEMTVSLVQFDLTTGEGTVVGQIGTFIASLGSGGPFLYGGGLAFDNDGTMYVSMRADNDAAPEPQCQSDTGAFCTYIVDPAALSSPTLLGPTTQASGALAFPRPSAFAISSCSGAFNGSQETDDVGPALTEISRTTGLGSIIGPENALIVGADYDSAGTLWGIDADDPAYRLDTIDPSTGVAKVQVSIDAEFVGPLAIAHPSCEAPVPALEHERVRAPAPEPVPAVVTFTG